MRYDRFAGVYRRFSIASIAFVFGVSSLIAAVAPLLLSQTTSAQSNAVRQLAITTPVQTIERDEPSAPINVQTQNGGGQPETVSDSVVVVLSSTSATGEFSGANLGAGTCSGNWGITQLTVAKNSANKSFCYRDSASGAYELTAATNETAPNGDLWVPASQTITINGDAEVPDTIKPTVDILSPAHGSVLNTASFTVEGNASDSQTTIMKIKYTVTRIDAIGGSYVANIDSGVAAGTTAWNFAVSSLSDGFYRLKVQAFDEAGNWKYKYNDVEIDTTAPVVAITTPTDSFKVGDSFNLAGTVDDPAVSELLLALDNGAPVPVPVSSGVWTYAGAVLLAASDISVTAQATDTAGNTGSSTAVFTVGVVAGVSTDTPAAPTNTGRSSSAAPNNPQQPQVLAVAFNSTNPESEPQDNEDIQDDEENTVDSEVLAGTTDDGSSITEDKQKEIVTNASAGFAWYWILLLLALAAAGYYGYRNWHLSKERS